jgi:hypothetical protein
MTELYNLGYCLVCKRPVVAFDVLRISGPRPDWQVICQAGAWCHARCNDDREHLIYMSLVVQPPGVQVELW